MRAIYIVLFIQLFIFSCNGTNDTEILLKDIAETNQILVDLKQKDSSLYVQIGVLVNEAEANKIGKEEFKQQFRVLQSELSKNDESRKVIENELVRLKELLKSKTKK